MAPGYVFQIFLRVTMNNLLSCRYNMDTNRVEARLADGTILAIDCIAVEYAQLVLGEEMEHYLSLGCDHGRLEDQ